MKKIFLTFAFVQSFTAYSADPTLKITQAELFAEEALVNSPVKQYELLGSGLLVELELSSITSDVEVSVLNEGIETVCSFTSPVKKTISRNWATAKIEIQFAPSTYASDESKCTFLIKDKESAKSVYLRLKEFR